jgi:hypothetical protein
MFDVRPSPPTPYDPAILLNNVRHGRECTQRLEPLYVGDKSCSGVQTNLSNERFDFTDAVES